MRSECNSKSDIGFIISIMKHHHELFQITNAILQFRLLFVGHILLYMHLQIFAKLLATPHV